MANGDEWPMKIRERWTKMIPTFMSLAFFILSSIAWDLRLSWCLVTGLDETDDVGNDETEP